MKKNIAMRDSFFDRLYDIAKKDRNIVVISADMGAPGLDKFRNDLGSQFINVGIAEENLVTVATGLALSNRKVFIYAIMPFATLRCFEMIKVDLSLMNLPVTIVGVGAGFSYNESGPTHHSTEDIAVMRSLPNMSILNASDSIMASEFAEISCKIDGPNYVRLDRQVLPLLYEENDGFSDGLTKLRNGKDMCIVSTGNMVHRALEVAGSLADNSVDAAVIDLYRLKPVNKELLLENITQSERVVTIEEHLLNGGLGGIVAEVMADNSVNLPLKRFAIPDKYYYAYGERENIQSLCGLDADSIIKGIENDKG